MIKIKVLMSFLTHNIDMMLKVQLLISESAQIFVLLYTLTNGEMTEGFFLKSTVRSFDFATLMFKSETLKPVSELNKNRTVIRLVIAEEDNNLVLSKLYNMMIDTLTLA